MLNDFNRGYEKGRKARTAELIKAVSELKTNDDFHEWYKDTLGEEDMLKKIIDKVLELLKEKSVKN
jgi:hypothetical protein